MCRRTPTQTLIVRQQILMRRRAPTRRRTPTQTLIVRQQTRMLCQPPSQAVSSNINGFDANSAVFRNDLLLVAFKIKHKLTGLAIGDLTQLCNFLGNGDSVSRNKYFLTNSLKRQQLASSYTICVRHAKSTWRKFLRPSYAAQIPTVLMTKLRKKWEYFFCLSIHKASASRSPKNHDVISLLNWVGNPRVKLNVDNCEDIYDGDLYKSNMLFGNTLNLSLNFNSDGVPVFKSSSCSIWPIMCTINELPPNVRKDHVLLAALWFGDSKSEMDGFFKPFVTKLRKLNETGFLLTSSDKSFVTTKVKALIGICDSVARPTLQGFCSVQWKA